METAMAILLHLSNYLLVNDAYTCEIE